MSALQGRRVLVTGASRGFGFAAARAMGAAGAQVIALARTVGGLEALDDRIKSAGGPAAVLVPLDVTDTDGLARMGAALHDRFGGLDLWLHTAASAPPLMPVARHAPKDWQKALHVNVEAFATLVRMVDPLLRLGTDPRALIATEDRTGQPFWGPYAATKAAQSALTQAWAQEARKQIAVAEVVPPAMPTALRGRFFPGEDKTALTPIDEAAGRLLQALRQKIAPGARIAL